MSPRAYSYIRMSTELQAEGDSFRRQKEKSIAFAAKHGLALDDHLKFDDIGVSAFKGKNLSEGGLGLFLEAVKDGTVKKGSYLLVESLDRISRQDIKKSAALLLQILSSGINVVTVSDERVYGEDTDFADLIYALVVLSRAHEESATKSIRLAAVWDHKRRSLNSRKLTTIAPAWLQLSEDRAHFLVIQNAAETVQRIFKLADAGVGSFSIARKLHEQGAAPIGRANTWHESYITKILSNRAVIGEFQPFKLEGRKRVPIGEPISGYFPAIIDPDLFYRVQAARRARRTSGGGRRGAYVSNLFSKLAKCGYCGSPMRFIDKGKGPKGGTYLRCSSSLRNLGCTASAWNYEDFENSFLLFVTEVDLQSVLSEAARKSISRDVADRISTLREEIANLELKRNRALDLYINGGGGAEFVQSRISALTDEINAKNAQIAAHNERLSSEGAGRRLNPDELNSLIGEIQDKNRSDLYEKRSLVAKRLQEIVTSLTLQPDGRVLNPKKLLLEDLKFDRERVARYFSDIKRLGTEGPIFYVTLSDRIHRAATVNPNDPSDLLMHAHLDGNKLVAGSIMGTRFQIS